MFRRSTLVDNCTTLHGSKYLAYHWVEMHFARAGRHLESLNAQTGFMLKIKLPWKRGSRNTLSSPTSLLTARIRASYHANSLKCTPIMTHNAATQMPEHIFPLALAPGKRREER
ncbi:hypothetical protein CERZMDRAFT_92230 [Cercospora zeae-maydis SCOH1-5]|uniref:Uncharacterized protein n=1 Tax=Cercospora zeae-maydis SCOH1-5 TaxID=717836 RepID=A0A6A6FWI1_9PEZI|nr:hypothetical protein CERZMDRAFT_92230 [Cercospora zeae-maydis SCOH1-5]